MSTGLSSCVAARPSCGAGRGDLARHRRCAARGGGCARRAGREARRSRAFDTSAPRRCESGTVIRGAWESATVAGGRRQRGCGLGLPAGLALAAPSSRCRRSRSTRRGIRTSRPRWSACTGRSRDRRSRHSRLGNDAFPFQRSRARREHPPAAPVVVLEQDALLPRPRVAVPAWRQRAAVELRCDEMRDPHDRRGDVVVVDQRVDVLAAGTSGLRTNIGTVTASSYGNPCRTAAGARLRGSRCPTGRRRTCPRGAWRGAGAEQDLERIGQREHHRGATLAVGDDARDALLVEQGWRGSARRLSDVGLVEARYVEHAVADRRRPGEGDARSAVAVTNGVRGRWCEEHEQRLLVGCDADLRRDLRRHLVDPVEALRVWFSRSCRITTSQPPKKQVEQPFRTLRRAPCGTLRS